MSRSLSDGFNGSADNVLRGAAIPAKDRNDFTFAFSFKVGELARINRLLQLKDSSFYLDNDNRLVFNSTKTVDAAAARAERQLLKMRVKARKGCVRAARADSPRN